MEHSEVREHDVGDFGERSLKPVLDSGLFCVDVVVSRPGTSSVQSSRNEAQILLPLGLTHACLMIQTSPKSESLEGKGSAGH